MQNIRNRYEMSRIDMVNGKKVRENESIPKREKKEKNKN
jgi:hypothetical protein